MEQAPDAVAILAERNAALRFESLPASTVLATKRLILDLLGIAYPGFAARAVPELHSVLTATYGAGGNARIWGSAGRLPAPEAALLNSAAAHALDFDDTHDRACLHAGASVVPAALAMAEQLGGVSGREFIAAVVAGVEWMCRMGVATRIPPNASGWMYTALYAYFGATAATSRLLGLDAGATIDAMGIAYGQAAGNTQCMPDGALSKRLQPGFGARAGVLSALLARSGISGVRNVLEGRAGLYNLYLRGEFDRERLLRDATPFEMENLSYKPYPCCRHNHTAIDAVLELMDRHSLRAADVAAVAVGVNGEAFRNVCEPRAIKAQPRNVVDAQFSIPWCVAVAVLERTVPIESLAPEALGDKRILAMASRVECRLDPAIDRDFGTQVSPAEVRITLKSGVSHVARKDFPLGSPEVPMDERSMNGKFRDCAAWRQPRWGGAETDRLIAAVYDLEKFGDVRQLVDLL